MTGRLPRRNPKHAKAQDLFQAFQTHCHPTRRRTHLQIRKAHLRPAPDRRGLGGDSPWCPGNPCTSSDCLLWGRPAQASIRPRPRPGACAFGALPLPPLRASELHLGPGGALAPSCGHRLEQPLSGWPSLSGSAVPGAAWAGAQTRVGAPSPAKKGPSTWALAPSLKGVLRADAHLGHASPWKSLAPNPSGCASLHPCGWSLGQMD